MDATRRSWRAPILTEHAEQIKRAVARLRLPDVRLHQEREALFHRGEVHLAVPIKRVVRGGVGHEVKRAFVGDGLDDRFFAEEAIAFFPSPFLVVEHDRLSWAGCACEPKTKAVVSLVWSEVNKSLVCSREELTCWSVKFFSGSPRLCPTRSPSLGIDKAEGSIPVGIEVEALRYAGNGRGGWTGLGRCAAARGGCWTAKLLRQ